MEVQSTEDYARMIARTEAVIRSLMPWLRTRSKRVTRLFSIQNNLMPSDTTYSLKSVEDLGRLLALWLLMARLLDLF